MRSILKRLLGRHTTAVAYLALFAALGGSAYAAMPSPARTSRTARSPAATSRRACSARAS